MNPENYEQIQVSGDMLGDSAPFLQEGMECQIALFNGTPISIELPQRVTLEIVETEGLSANTGSDIEAHVVTGLMLPMVRYLAVRYESSQVHEIRLIMIALLNEGLSPADIWLVKQGNGGVSVVDYPHGPGGVPVVSCLNLTGHLGGVIDSTAAGAL